MESISQPASSRVQLQIHPRVFSALGSDLVTSDIVAVIELVKNSYDAYATTVHVHFGHDESEGVYLEITDDGCGMSRNILENVWCVIATPYKKENPLIGDNTRQRRVSGEKGLGRLSAARLGKKLRMLTEADNDICWEVTVDWHSISQGDNLLDSFINCELYDGDEIFEFSGTRIQIFDLNEPWNEHKLDELEDNLSRLMSPFSEVNDFRILFSRSGEEKEQEIEIEAPLFLSKPKYSIRGEADTNGNVSAYYEFNPIKEGKSRNCELEMSWSKIVESIKGKRGFAFDENGAKCGTFNFEIRAWDIAPDDTEEISEQFYIQKSKIRAAIRVRKGISVYRDHILVLPKSDSARDWLGLDFRRISRVGSRLSTNQIIGFVSITANHNPKIQDTSDRERIASTKEAAEFGEILKVVVAMLENERVIDRTQGIVYEPMEDLLSNLNAEELLVTLNELVENKASAKDVVTPVREHDRRLKFTRKSIEKRFFYYSRMATVGTISQMLIHEIRNRTSIIGNFLISVAKIPSLFNGEKFKTRYDRTGRALDGLEKLADTFAPLANARFSKQKRKSVLEDQINDCLELQERSIVSKGIKCSKPNTRTGVAVDPGELDTILLNLILNAVYWLDEMPLEKRKLNFTVENSTVPGRVTVVVEDTGPGISEADSRMIFNPGVTRKPDGIGMGLTVAAELVHSYGGEMGVGHNGNSGACFVFDLPLDK